MLFNEAFEYGDGAKFRGGVGTNSDPLSVQFGNFVQCHILVSSVTLSL
jgi:hypothetical protein